MSKSLRRSDCDFQVDTPIRNQTPSNGKMSYSQESAHQLVLPQTFVSMPENTSEQQQHDGVISTAHRPNPNGKLDFGETDDVCVTRANPGDTDESPEDSPNSNSSTGPREVPSTNPSSPEVTPTKRNRPTKDGGDETDSNKGGNEKRPRKSPKRRLACPYYKNNPAAFRLGPCVGPGFLDIAKMKEHLYRNHHHDFQCQRCKKPFGCQAKLDHHAEGILWCNPQLRTAQDGLTTEKFWDLKRKDQFRNRNEEDKWKEIYRLLFGDCGVSGDTLPLPYIEDEPQSHLESPAILGTQPSDRSPTRLFPNEFERRSKTILETAVSRLEMQFSGIFSDMIQDFRDTLSIPSEPKQYNITEEDKENIRSFSEPSEFVANTSNSDPTSINFALALWDREDTIQKDIWGRVDSSNSYPFEFYPTPEV